MPWVPNQIPLIHTCCKNAGAYGAPPYGRTPPRTNNLDGSTDARGTWTKVDHPVRHRSNESPVIVLTCGSPMATPLQCTSSTPCEWCCNLMSRTRRRRTSQASLQGPPIPSIGCHRTPRSRMRFQLRNHPQTAFRRNGIQWYKSSKTKMWLVGLGVGAGVGSIPARIDQPFS